MIHAAPARATAAERDDGGSRVTVAAIAMAAVGLMAIAAMLLASGSKSGAVLALALAGAPVLLYLAIRRPFIFPFGLYAVLVPFNHIIVISGLGTLTKFAGILASVALLLAVVRTKRVVRPPGVLFGWLAFVTWACASIAWALNPNDSLTLIGTLLQLFFLFAVTAIAPISRGELRVVMAMIVLGGAAAAAYGGKLFLGGAQTYGNRLFLKSGSGGEYLDPNHFAAALLLPLALALVWAFKAPKLFGKLVSFAALAALLIGVYASGSRGALVAAAFMALFVAWRTGYWLQSIIIAALGGVLSLAVKTSVWSRFLADVGTGSGRTSIWMIGAHAFMGNPVIGAGVGNFPDAYDQSLLHQYTPIFAYWDRGAHNLILMVGVELGVIGLALLLWVMAGQARMLRGIGRGHELYDVRIGLEAALVGLLVASMFLDTLYWKYAWLTFTALVLARSASIAPSEEPVSWSTPAAVRADEIRRRAVMRS
jgi:O-antigen ligase